MKNSPSQGSDDSKKKIGWQIFALSITSNILQTIEKDNKIEVGFIKNKEDNISQYPPRLDDASEITKKYRDKLVVAKDTKKMDFFKKILSYNHDGTVNIIPLKKIFCEDISGQNKKITFEQAQELEKTNISGYRLLSDYDDYTTQEQEKKTTDIFKLFECFSPYKESIPHMLGCDDWYWTASKNNTKDMASSIGLVRSLIVKSRGNAKNTNKVCGIKDM